MKVSEVTKFVGKRKRPKRKDRVKRMVQKHLHLRSIDEAEGKNTHLEHLEDEILNKGYPGVQSSIAYLKSLYNMLKSNTSDVRVTTKWDGAPAIVSGPDPKDGKFFVGTKGVFAKEPKLNKTTQDIENNHGDVVQKGETISKEGLRSKLRPALEHLSKLGMKRVMQGDIIFTPEMLKDAEIGGQSYITFKPNTITYAVPSGSDLAKRIRQAKIGIIFHTTYEGDDLATSKARFGAEVDDLNNSPDVFVDNADIKDFSGKATLTAEESAQVKSAINDATKLANEIGSNTFDVLDTTDVKDLVQQLKAHINNYVKAGSFVEPDKYAVDFIKRMQDRYTAAIEKLKTEKGKERARAAADKGLEYIQNNQDAIMKIYKLYVEIMNAKLMFVKKLSLIDSMPAFYAQPDGSFEVADPEGFVAVDHMGSAVKLVDRLKFSRQNFAPKSFG